MNRVLHTHSKNALWMCALLVALSANDAHASREAHMLDDLVGPLLLVSTTGAVVAFGAFDLAYWTKAENLPHGLAVAQVITSVPVGLLGAAFAWGPSESIRPFGYFILGASPILLVGGLIDLQLAQSRNRTRAAPRASVTVVPLPGGAATLWTVKL